MIRPSWYGTLLSEFIEGFHFRFFYVWEAHFIHICICKIKISYPCSYSQSASTRVCYGPEFAHMHFNET